jgi:KDO2-lipid IV(A) lauroyltransferase
MPRGLVLALGRGLGRLWADLDPRHVAIAVDNLRHAFPQWEEARLRRTARGVYVHFGQVVLDILWLQGRDARTLLSLVDVEGGEAVRAALAEGRGAVMAAGHLGNWELGGIVMGWLFGPAAVVARPLDNPSLDDRLVAFRQMSGNIVLHKRNVLAQALRLMRSGKAVAFLVDQNTLPEEGIFVDFFGRPAATTPAASALAVKLGCPVIHGWAQLRPNGRYLLRLGTTRPRAGAERAAEVRRLTQEITTIIEEYVRSAPEQWLWLHRRWKTRPPEERTAAGAATARVPRDVGEPPAETEDAGA